MDFSACKTSWHNIGLPRWQDMPTRFAHGYWHRVFAMKTTRGTYALKCWDIRHESGLDVCHLRQCLAMTQYISQRHTWCTPEHLLCVDDQRHIAWSYRPWCEGTTRKPSMWQHHHVAQLVQTLLDLHQLRIAPQHRFLPRCWLSHQTKASAPLTPSSIPDAWVFCHGDMQSDHLFWQNQTLVDLIDWECAGWMERHQAVAHAALSIATHLQTFDHHLCGAIMATYHQRHALQETLLQTAFFDVLAQWRHWWLAVKNLSSKPMTDNTPLYAHIAQQYDTIAQTVFATNPKA